MASVGTTAADNPSASTVSMGAGLWFVASGLVASLAGGASSPGGSRQDPAGAAALHGLVSWAVTTLVVLYLLTSAASGLVGGTLSTVSGARGGAGSLVAARCRRRPGRRRRRCRRSPTRLDGIEDKVRQQTAGQGPAGGQGRGGRGGEGAVHGDPSQKQQAEAPRRRRLAKAQNIPVDQARQQIQDYEKQYDQAVASGQAEGGGGGGDGQVGGHAGAFYAALALILGALAAYVGGRLGAPKPATLLGAYETGALIAGPPSADRPAIAGDPLGPPGGGRSPGGRGAPAGPPEPRTTPRGGEHAMSSTTDKIKGLANEAVGNVKQAAGKATGNDKLVAEGKAQELKGEAQEDRRRRQGRRQEPRRQGHRQALIPTRRRRHAAPPPRDGAPSPREQESCMNRDPDPRRVPPSQGPRQTALGG